jgi:hypothetical protein
MLFSIPLASSFRDNDDKLMSVDVMNVRWATYGLPSLYNKVTEPIPIMGKTRFI